MLDNLRIGVRLGIGFAVVAGLFAVTLLAVGVSLSSLVQDVGQINDKTLPYVLVVDEMDLSRSEVQQFLTDVAATHDRAAYKEAEAAAKRFLNGAEKFRQLYQRENDANRLKQIETIEADFNRFYAEGKAMAEAYITKGMDAGNLLMKGSKLVTGFDRDSETLSDNLEKFREQQVTEARITVAGALNDASFTMSGMIWGGLAAALLAAFFSVWIMRGVLRQMGGEPKYAAEVASRIAGGDLAAEVQIKTGDSSSLLYSLSTMQDSLKTLVSNIKDSTGSVSTGASEIAAGNSDLSRRTEEQATALEETASSMEQMTATVKQNAENARHASQLAKGASEIAAKGVQVVSQVVGTMGSISESSKKIVDIISVIDGIAFQTNILALNAAVEAARAGEQGRGFAVVASEVRNLAQRSATAANEIKALIGDSVGKVETGSRLVREAGETLDDVVTSFDLVANLVAEISTASSEQSAGIEQINRTIIQMDEATQQNAALVEEAAAATESLEEEAQSLSAAASVFKLGMDSQPQARRVAASRSAARPGARHALDAPAKRQSIKPGALPEKAADGEWEEF